MMMLSRIGIGNGWLLKFMVTLPDALHDTTEFLVTSVLETLRKENCSYFTKGVIPLERIGEFSGMGPIGSKLVKVTYSLISKIFRFGKRKEYWLRYHPHTEPAYLVLTGPKIKLNELKALTKVFHSSYSFY
jgi:lysylphosphatidylglycerol synthetase-like protein (DUF2156 family)